MNYLVHLSIMILLYAMLTYSLNLVVGFGGLLSLCHAAFYGIGAYTCTLLLTAWNWPFPLALVAAVAVCGAVALIVSLPALRFRGDRFVLMTLAFQSVVFAVLYNWVPLTRGPYGIPGIPHPAFAGLRIRTPLAFLAVTGIVAAMGWAALLL